LNEKNFAPIDRVGLWSLKWTGPRSKLRYFWHRVLQLRATPHEVALGFAIGVFTACTPFLGIQTILAVVLAFVFRVSMPAAFLGTFVSNPLSWPAIWSASYVSGALLLGQDPTYAANHLGETADVISAIVMAPSSQTFAAALDNLSPIVEPMLVGGLLVGSIAAIFSYYPTRRAVRIFQRHRKTG
jgi:hypothetical protein